MIDASHVGWGAVLCQIDPSDKKKKPEVCQYASGLWAKNQLNWATLKEELRTLCLGIAKFKDFVIYTKFTVKTDCQALKYAIQKCDFEDAVMVRWVMQLSQYNFDIEFISGEKNSFADMFVGPQFWSCFCSKKLTNPSIYHPFLTLSIPF